MNQSFYADSSVLVKRHLNEVGSNWVVSLTEQSQNNYIFTANLSIVEVQSSFNRKLREAALTKTDYEQARDAFLLAGNEYNFIKLDSAITEAKDLLEKHSLRAGDAVQLASSHSYRELKSRTANLYISMFMNGKVAMQSTRIRNITAGSDRPNNFPHMKIRRQIEIKKYQKFID